MFVSVLNYNKVVLNRYSLFLAMDCVDHEDHEFGYFIDLKIWQLICSKEAGKQKRSN